MLRSLLFAIWMGITCQVLLSYALTVYLHVGPHKTGSTHVQKFAIKNRKEMFAVGVCLPFSLTPPYHNKVLSRAIVLLTNKGNITAVKRVLDSCIKHANHYEKIFISAESLSVLEPKNLALFHSLFPKDTKFVVMFAYREWLSKMYSQYTQIAKMNILVADTLGEYIFRNFGYIDYHSTKRDAAYDFLEMVENFERYFGQENLYILDYLGVQEQHKDIVHVYFCEIMNILCNLTTPLNQVTVKFNVKPEGQYIHAAGLVRDYTFTRSYTFRDSLPQFFTRDLIVNYSKTVRDLPVRSSNLQLLHDYAKKIDSKVRTVLQNRIHYANESATKNAIHEFQATEIDTTRFYSNERWIKWLESEFHRLGGMGMIRAKSSDHADSHKR